MGLRYLSGSTSFGILQFWDWLSGSFIGCLQKAAGRLHARWKLLKKRIHQIRQVINLPIHSSNNQYQKDFENPRGSFYNQRGENHGIF
jgi:hypothetical protein